MTDSQLDALTEISITYLHEWIDSLDRHYFARTSQEWMTQRGFYGSTCLIPYPPHERWCSMMGMPPSRKVDRYFDENGRMVDYDLPTS